QLVAPLAQALDDRGAAFVPLALERDLRRARRVGAAGVDDPMEVVTEFGQRGLGRLALEVPQLMHAAALHGGRGPERADRPPHPPAPPPGPRWSHGRRLFAPPAPPPPGHPPPPSPAPPPHRPNPPPRLPFFPQDGGPHPASPGLAGTCDRRGCPGLC